MGKILTFGEAKSRLNKFVDNGTCNTSIISARINEAVQRLIAKKELEDSPRLNYLVRIKVSNNEFALPRGVEKILAADINGKPGIVFNKMYQFLDSGPGDLNCNTETCARHLMDLGEFPYVFELPDVATGSRLMAFSTARETTTVKVYGYDYQNNEVMEELPINTFHAGTEGRIEGEYRTGNTLVGSTYFKEISKVIKTETSAAITLYAVNPDTEQIWFVAKYHMKDKVPMFRRYRIVNKKYHTGEADDPKYSTCILAMVKLGHVELHDDDDIVPIDSEAALKLMLIAIKYENDGNLSQAVNYEAKAMQVLQDAISNHSLTQGTPVVIDFQTKLMGGRTLNIRRALI